MFNGTECFIEPGKPVRADGYIFVSYLGTSMGSYRAAYLREHGAIPDGLEIDHLCLNKACSEVTHFEAVTRLENMRRRAALITHCPRGHAYDEVNTYNRKPGSNGRRVCRTCNRERMRGKRTVDTSYGRSKTQKENT